MRRNQKTFQNENHELGVKSYPEKEKNQTKRRLHKNIVGCRGCKP